MEHSRGERNPPVAEGDRLRLMRFSYFEVDAGEPPLDLSLLVPASPCMPLVMVTGEEEGEVSGKVVAGCVWSSNSPSGGGDTVVVGACGPTGAVSWPRMLHVCIDTEHRCIIPM